MQNPQLSQWGKYTVTPSANPQRKNYVGRTKKVLRVRENKNPSLREDEQHVSLHEVNRQWSRHADGQTDGAPEEAKPVSA